MSANSCPRCGKALPEATLRALTQGTTCPYCAAPLKRTPKRAPAAAPADDEGYASFEMSAAPAPPPAPPPAKAAPPATAAASPKIFRQTMVGGTAVAARSLPFEGTPAPERFSLSPPVSTPVPPAPVAEPRATSAATSTAPLRSGAAAALARTIAAPAPMRTPGARPSVAPAASKPHRSLTPAQALDLPPPTPAPVLNTPSPIASSAPRLATVGPPMAESHSAPTRVSALPGLVPAPVRPLVTDDESGPTNVVLPMVPEAGAATHDLKFPDSEPVIDSVTMAPDPEPQPRPVMAVPLPPSPAPRRGMVLVGVGMGLSIVALAIVAFKLVRGSGRKAAPPIVAQSPAPAEPPAPLVEAVAPAPAAEESPAPRKATTTPKSKAKVKAAPSSEPMPAPKAKAKVTRKQLLAEKRAAAAAQKHLRAAEKARANRERRAARARAVATREPAPKRGAAPAVPAERADPRTPYEHGNTLLFAGDGKGAIAAYREAVRSAPTDPIGFRGLGLAYEQQGETAQAIKALRRYLKLAPAAADRELIAKRIDKLSKRAKSK